MITIGLIGRLGADATSTEFAELQRFAINFNVCTNVQKKDPNGQYYDVPQWYRVTYFVKSTAILPYLTKGTQVYLHGEPLIESFVSKTTGAQMVSASITANRVELIGSRKEAESEK